MFFSPQKNLQELKVLYHDTESKKRVKGHSLELACKRIYGAKSREDLEKKFIKILTLITLIMIIIIIINSKTTCIS